MKSKLHTCLVCDYPKLTEAPRTRSGGGSYEICPSCGFQFGVDDDDKGITFEAARAAWIAGGSKWHSKGTPKPEDWPAKPPTPVAKKTAKKAVKKTVKKAVKKAAPRKKKG